MDLYLSGVCLILCLKLICVVSAEQISQVISRAECYLYLSLSSLSLLSHLNLLSLDPPLTSSCSFSLHWFHLFRFSSFLIASLLQPSLCTCQLSINLLFPLSRLVHFTIFLAFWPFLPPSHVLKTPLLFHVPLTFTAFTWDNFQSRKLFTFGSTNELHQSETSLFLLKTWRRLNIL